MCKLQIRVESGRTVVKLHCVLGNKAWSSAALLHRGIFQLPLLSGNGLIRQVTALDGSWTCQHCPTEPWLTHICSEESIPQIHALISTAARCGLNQGRIYCFHERFGREWRETWDHRLPCLLCNTAHSRSHMRPSCRIQDTRREVLSLLMHWFSLNITHYDECNASSASSSDE